MVFRNDEGDLRGPPSGKSTTPRIEPPKTGHDGQRRLADDAQDAVRNRLGSADLRGDRASTCGSDNRGRRASGESTIATAAPGSAGAAVAERVGTSESTVYLVVKAFTTQAGRVEEVITCKKRATPPVEPKVTGDREARVMAGKASGARRPGLDAGHGNAARRLPDAASRSHLLPVAPTPPRDLPGARSARLPQAALLRGHRHPSTRSCRTRGHRTRCRRHLRA
ncbi:MAG: hypothetical protein QG608_3705 [Actinomycetota bacterium]|nr:hypothetical protein [Actinomycetota bacterium]